MTTTFNCSKGMIKQVKTLENCMNTLDHIEFSTEVESANTFTIFYQLSYRIHHSSKHPMG